MVEKTNRKSNPRKENRGPIARHWGRRRGVKGALRMDMWVRVKRGLVVAGLLLGIGVVGLPAGVSHCSAGRNRSHR